jgi:hypothetical protein
MAARHWTPEQRAQQAAKISQWQPWTKSTGARTPEGKAASSQNAYKGGFREELRQLARLLREYQVQRKQL